MSEHFSSIGLRYLRRRQFLQVAVASTVVALPSGISAAPKSGPGFNPVPIGLTSNHQIADGHAAQLLLRWGDGLDGSPAKELPLSAEQQQRAFGFNNDFIAYMPLEGSRRGLLCVNHEYSIPHLMFPGVLEESIEAYGRLSLDSIRAEMAAIGHSVIEVVRKGREWQVVAGSNYARRITPSTPTLIDGPAAGHARMRTAADTSGRKALGILGCCSGGKTPWGTVLIAEENFGDFFRGDPETLREQNSRQADDAREFGANEGLVHWARAESRFDILQEPNELNRFGWVVELDPFDSSSMPVKRTALGHFEHEGATVVCEHGRPAIVYSGDDSENQFIYRFVSRDIYREDDPAANKNLLSDGTLYCARFHDDGSGRWMPMLQGQEALSAENGFTSQAEVVLDARRAARLLGATPMDRPEGIAVDPSTGSVFVALTQNEERTESAPANPRVPNFSGHIVELLPPSSGRGRDHWADNFNWDIFMLGHSRHPEGRDWPCNPDNVMADGRGRLWIATDGATDFGFADGLWCADVQGPQRGIPHQLFRCPRGAELCSPEMTPDGRTIFVSVQHPGKDDGSSFDKPSTRWPDFRAGLPPRSSIMALMREDGAILGQ